MNMQQVCAATLEEVDGALGCIVIDAQTGLTVAAEYRPGSSVNDGTINLVSVVSANMFAGRLMQQFESALAVEPTPGFVREVQMTAANTNQFMAAIPGWNDGVFVLVTEKSVSLGLGWMAVHRVVERIQIGASHDGGAANDGQAARPSQQVATDTRVAARQEIATQRHASQSERRWAQPAPAPYGDGAPISRPPGVPQPAPPHAIPPQQAVSSAQRARPGARAAAPSAIGQASKEPEERPVAVVGARANFLSRKKRGEEAGGKR